MVSGRWSLSALTHVLLPRFPSFLSFLQSRTSLHFFGVFWYEMSCRCCMCNAFLIVFLICCKHILSSSSLAHARKHKDGKEEREWALGLLTQCWSLSQETPQLSEECLPQTWPTTAVFLGPNVVLNDGWIWLLKLCRIFSRNGPNLDSGWTFPSHLALFNTSKN